MSSDEPKLSLEPDGVDFVLRRVAEDGTITQMRLSENDILTLCRSIPNLQQEILSRHAPKGADHSPVSVTEVVRVGLGQESLGERILLTLIAPSGGQATFAIPPQIVNLLIERLPVHLAQMIGTKPTKQ